MFYYSAILSASLSEVVVSTLVTAVHQHALRRVVESEGKTYLPCVDRLLLSLLFHCSKDANHSRAMKDVEAALACTFFWISYCSNLPHNVRLGISGAEIALPKVPATACLTVRIPPVWCSLI